MPSEPLHLEVMDELGALSTEWDDVVSLMERPSPFLRSWWLDGAAAGTPAIVVVRRGGVLIGGAAFELDRLGRGPVSVERVRCLGQGPLAPDHLDVVAAPTDVADVLDAVLAWLRGSGPRVVDLDGLADGGALAGSLRDHVASRTAAPFASLTGGIDGYLAARPGKLRSTIGRTARRLEREGSTMTTVTGPATSADEADGVRAEAERALRDLHRLHDQRWSDESGFLDAWDRFVAVATAGIERGEVRIHEVTSAAGEVVATELDLVLGDIVAFYQAGRRTEREWRGAGTALRAWILRNAADSGAAEYDLLRGDEPYKADWSTGRRDLVRVRLGVGRSGRVVHAAGSAWRRCAPHVHALAQRLRRGGSGLNAP